MKKVVLFCLNNNGYLRWVDDEDYITTTSDYKDALQFTSEEKAIAFLVEFEEQIAKKKLFDWCTRTYYNLRILKNDSDVD